MNSTENSFQLSPHYYSDLLGALSFGIALGALLISTLLFPFYFKTFRKNRKRDEKEAIFPYLNHFSHLLCITEPATLLIFIPFLIVLGTEDLATVNWTDHEFFAILFGLLFPIRVITSISTDMITSILSINRFILYYHGRKGDKYFEKFHKFIICFEYLLTLVMLLSAWQAHMEPGTQYRHQFDDNLVICHFLTTCLVSLCTIAYSIAFGRSVKLEAKNPEQCIKYQITLGLLSKLVIYPGSLLLGKYMKIDHFPVFVLVNSCVTPLTLQLAYFWSNKKKSFWKKKKGNSKVVPGSIYTVSSQTESREN